MYLTECQLIIKYNNQLKNFDTKLIYCEVKKNLELANALKNKNKTSVSKINMSYSYKPFK